MKLATIEMSYRTLWGTESRLECTGYVLGELFIHQRYPDVVGNARQGNWHVSHIKTGYAIKTGINRRDEAVRLARELNKLKCWDFTDPKVINSWPTEQFQAVRALVRAAA